METAPCRTSRYAADLEDYKELLFRCWIFVKIVVKPRWSNATSCYFKVVLLGENRGHLVVKLSLFFPLLGTFILQTT